MLKLSKLLKSIFRSVIFLLLILEVILLVSILLIYRNNTEEIKKGLQKNIQDGILKYRDLFVTYLADKYYLLAEDILYIIRTYESILNNTNYPINNNLTDIELNCMINGNNIFKLNNSSEYSKEWYSTPDSSLQSRLLGNWFTTRDQLTFDKLGKKEQYYIQSMCSMTRLFRDILTKHLNWKDYFGVTNDQYYFAFSNSFFVKFPSFNNSYMKENGSWTDTSRKDCNTTRDINTYDPICRPFYIDTMKSREKIASSSYLMASSGLYGKYY